jgi:hypothetical protein
VIDIDIAHNNYYARSTPFRPRLAKG